MNNALGLIEVVGLATAIKTADVMLKAASVKLLKLEKAKGSGWMTIFVTGDVGAVNAAIESGTASAKGENKFVSSKVIARPGEGIESLISPESIINVPEEPIITVQENDNAITVSSGFQNEAKDKTIDETNKEVKEEIKKQGEKQTPKVVATKEINKAATARRSSAYTKNTSIDKLENSK